MTTSRLTISSVYRDRLHPAGVLRELKATKDRRRERHGNPQGWSEQHYRRFLLGRQVLRHGEHGLVDERRQAVNAALDRVFGHPYLDPQERRDAARRGRPVPAYDRYGNRLDQDRAQAA